MASKAAPIPAQATQESPKSIKPAGQEGDLDSNAVVDNEIVVEASVIVFSSAMVEVDSGNSVVREIEVGSALVIRFDKVVVSVEADSSSNPVEVPATIATTIRTDTANVKTGSKSAALIFSNLITQSLETVRRFASIYKESL